MIISFCCFNLNRLNWIPIPFLFILCVRYGYKCWTISLINFCIILLRGHFNIQCFHKRTFSVLRHAGYKISGLAGSKPTPSGRHIIGCYIVNLSGIRFWFTVHRKLRRREFKFWRIITCLSIWRCYFYHSNILI